ncbi:MAG TPA: mechanosensitive ion channel family protein [Burkholderiales bacterium]|nr:mechanosensitive ion channel family protein [Burkholderiales bacterium]
MGLLGPLVAGAADAPAVADATRTAPAPLVFNNRTIVVFRAPLLGHTPSDRAEAAAHRIGILADRRSGSAVSSRPIPQGIAVEIDGAAAFVVTPGDVDDLGGATLQSTADEAERALGLALREVQEQASVRQLLKAVLLAVVGALIYGGALYGIVVAKRRLSERLSAALQVSVGSLKMAGVVVVHPTQFLTLARRLVVLTAWLLGLFATYLWLTQLLGLFPYTRPWGEQLSGYLVGLVGSMLSAIVHAVPGLVTVVIIFLITRYVARLIDGFFQRVETQHIRIGWLDADTARPTRRLVTVVLWLFALVMAYPYLPGAHTDAFKGLSVLVGLMVSIGASSLVGQAASGLILMYSRALRGGEYVKIGEAEGTVVEMGFFATRIHTGTGEELILPNAFVVANTTRNFSRTVPGRGFALQVKVTIGYSTPWRQVHAMLLEAARRTRGILTEPASYVIQAALSDFYVEYKLVAYAGPEAPAQRALALNDLNANVQDVFNEHGVQIMSPHYLGDPAHPQVVPKERWFEPPAKKPDG